MRFKPMSLLLGLLVLAMLAWALSSTVTVQAGAAGNVPGGYSLWWWSPTSGGGTSAASSYTVSGVIGVGDAALLSAGGYQVQGNIWPGSSSTQKVFIPAVVR